MTDIHQGFQVLVFGGLFELIMPKAIAARILFALLVAACAGAQLQCPIGLPGGSKYLLCLAGNGTPSPQPEPYPIQLGYPGINFLQEYAGIFGPDAVRLFRRQALDFFFTYFHLNYEQSLIPAGTTLDQLAAPAPGPNNNQNQTIWSLQSYALDPAGDTPSLQRLCNSFGCADLSPGQIPVHMGGYQLQVQHPFTARDCTQYYIGDLLTYSLVSINTTLLTSINAQRTNGGNSAKAGMLITDVDPSNSGGNTVIYTQSRPGSQIAVSRQYQNGDLVIDEIAEMQAQSTLFGSSGQTRFYYYVQNPLSASGGGAINPPKFESVTLQEVLQFY
ncbi:hypothetical protein WJX77_012454 [Trebouxia sp. C0004]